MTTTWASRLATDAHKLRLAVRVQGIPTVFQDDVTDVPSTIAATSRPKARLVTSIEQGETTINLARRRQEGGSLTVRLKDDDAGTLRAIFTPRKYRKTYCTTSHTDSVSTITVKTTAWAATSGTIYIGAETITYTGKTATTFTGCTRGAHQSTAQVHLGGTGDGAGVFDCAPSWLGRRVTLIGYFINEDGTTNGSLDQTLGTFRLESAPRHMGDDEWELQCSELSDEFGAKKIGGGLVDVELAEEKASLDVTTGHAFIRVGAGMAYNQFVAGDLETYVLAYNERDQAIAWPLIGQVDDADDDTIEASLDGQLVDPAPTSVVLRSVRHIAVLRDHPGRVALWLLSSRLGDADNGSYDVLPGREPDAFGRDAWRMGAGIAIGEIDSSAFLEVGSKLSEFCYIIDDEADLADFLHEFCIRTNSFWLVDRDGDLTVRTLADDAAASVLTIDDSVIIDSHTPTIEYDEQSITPRARLECNYDPLERRYCATVNILDSEMGRRYPGRDDALELRSKSIVVDEGPRGGRFGVISRPTLSRTSLETQFRRLQVAGGRGRAVVSLVCGLPALAAQVGDVVTLDLAVPDLEGNASLSDRLGRVVSMRPRYDDGEVDLRVELIDKLWRIAPAAVIASAAAAVLTLRTTGPEVSDAQPGDMFAVGNTVELHYPTTGAVALHTVLGRTSTTVTLDSAPAVAITANTDFIRLGASGYPPAVNTNGYVDFLYQMPDDETEAGTGDDITRWR